MGGQQSSEIGHSPAQDVQIHVDQKPYASPRKTTGRVLYTLASIPNGHQLYRDGRGDGEDDPIYADSETVQVSNGDQFHSDPKPHPGFLIFVNSREETVPKKTVSYDQIVKLAYPTPPDGQDVMYVVTYSNGPKPTPTGTLVAGQTVSIKHRMIFNVKVTNRS